MDYFQTFHQFLATSWLAVLYVSIALGTFAYLINELDWSAFASRPGVRFRRTRIVVMHFFVGLVLAVLAVLWPSILTFYFMDTGM